MNNSHDVLVILTNYSRPQNMSRVIASWRDQTVPCKIVVVDNTFVGDKEKKLRPDEERCGGIIVPEKYPYWMLGATRQADDVWRWTENSGCPCWLAPAVMLYGHRYVLRADDDFLPGRRAVEYLLDTARTLKDEFTTIGQIGRRAESGATAYVYHRGNVPRETYAVRTDLTCRVSFMRAEVPMMALAWRNLLLKEHPSEETSRLVGVHDDFLLCCGAQRMTGWPSYVIARTDDPETELVKTEIPNGPEACYKRPNHYAERETMVALSVRAGWRSLC